MVKKIRVLASIRAYWQRFGEIGSCVFCLAPAAQHGCCDGCKAALPRIEHCCRLCALPLKTKKEWQDLCAGCLRGKSHLDGAWCAFHYDYPLKKALHHFKFNRHLYYGRILGQLWLGSLRQDFPIPDLLMPVPLHIKRLRLRGFNPAYELAKPLAAHLNLPLRDDICVRVKDTKAQMDCPPARRTLNVRGAFDIRSGTAPTLRSKSVLILDDVMTTGATVREMARVLKRAGVERVEAWSLLRSSNIYP